MQRHQHDHDITQSASSSERWLRCREVADLLAVSERQVWRMAQSDGRSPAVLEPARLRMPGRTRPLTRWKLSDVHRLLDQPESP